MTAPKPRHVYIGGPNIQPDYLVGRRLLVKQVLTPRQIHRLTGGAAIAHTDLELAQGKPMPGKAWHESDEPDTVVVSVLVRGRPKTEHVNVRDWDATLTAGLLLLPARSPQC